TLVVVASALLTTLRFGFKSQSLIRLSQFFFLGSGFLLMETRAMLAISVLFGSTWIVNSIVISIVLLMALIANWAVMKLKCFTQAQGYWGLLAGLCLLYVLPLSELSGWSMPMKALGSTVVLGLPFFFAGIVFSRAFARVAEPGRALGINILGAMLGGCLEYLSLVTGTGGLTILAGAVYVLSWLCLRYQHTQST
ncbi:MAG: hypothetical protein HY711_03025, partial [Candidatus Melainabacteria bacterium]|nr:hypothetical protein [Candidatus Melainabacteria bacterium]